MSSSLEAVREAVVFQDRPAFDEKLARIAAAGPDHTHIVADFDRTLTKSVRADGSINTSMASLWYFMPNEFVVAAKALYAKYRSIEIDPGVSAGEKKREMAAWQHEWGNISIQSGLSRDIIRSIVRTGTLLPRDGLRTFVRAAEASGMPMLIFSAGLGDLIRGYLEYHDAYFDGIRIISNFGVYDDGGKCTGWSDQVITSMNKNERHLHAKERAEIRGRRQNVVLLGDHAADIHMADGEEHDTILSVGYLNGEMNNLSDHKAVFDAVIVEDGSLDFPNKILQKIGSKA